MLCAIREAKRRIQVNKVAYCPILFKAIIIKKSHPTEFDESDDLELIKKICIKRFKYVNIKPI